jgi:hypothetical protein
MLPMMKFGSNISTVLENTSIEMRRIASTLPLL